MWVLEDTNFLARQARRRYVPLSLFFSALHSTVFAFIARAEHGDRHPLDDLERTMTVRHPLSPTRAVLTGHRPLSSGRLRKTPLRRCVPRYFVV